MLWYVLALLSGLALLVWSADKFVDGAASTAKYAGMPPLLMTVLSSWGIALLNLR